MRVKTGGRREQEHARTQPDLDQASPPAERRTNRIRGTRKPQQWLAITLKRRNYDAHRELLVTSEVRSPWDAEEQTNTSGAGGVHPERTADAGGTGCLNGANESVHRTDNATTPSKADLAQEQRINSKICHKNTGRLTNKDIQVGGSARGKGEREKCKRTVSRGKTKKEGKVGDRASGDS